VPHDPSQITLIWGSTHIYDYYQCWRQLMLIMLISVLDVFVCPACRTRQKFISGLLLLVFGSGRCGEGRGTNTDKTEAEIRERWGQIIIYFTQDTKHGTEMNIYRCNNSLPKSNMIFLHPDSWDCVCVCVLVPKAWKVKLWENRVQVLLHFLKKCFKTLVPLSSFPFLYEESERF